MSPLLIEGMHGLGDNLYQRAVLRAIEWGDRPLYLVTSWPQLYADMPHVRCVSPGAVRLRTQAKNAGRRDHRWHSPPPGAERIRWHYVHRDGSIPESLFQAIGRPAPRSLDMTGPPVAPLQVARPYVLVRPVTIRKEWHAESRNPLPEYVAYAAAAARRAGYQVVSVADLQPGEEWAVGPLPVADAEFHRGELPIEQVLQYVAGASATIGGVGWAVPASLAYNRRMLLIYGGWGAHNGPDRIFGPLIDTARIAQLLPDRFCMCTANNHNCDKTITGAEAKIDEFFARLD